MLVMVTSAGVVGWPCRHLMRCPNQQRTSYVAMACEALAAPSRWQGADFVVDDLLG